MTLRWSMTVAAGTDPLALLVANTCSSGGALKNFGYKACGMRKEELCSTSLVRGSGALKASSNSWRIWLSKARATDRLSCGSSGRRAHGDDRGGRPQTSRSGMLTAQRTSRKMSAYGVAGLDPIEGASLEKSSNGCLGEEAMFRSPKSR